MPRRTLLCATAVTLALLGLTVPAYAGSSSDRGSISHRHQDSHNSWSSWVGSRGDSDRNDEDSEDEDSNDEDSGSNGSDEDDSDTPTSDTGTGVTVPEVGVQATLGGTGTGAVLTGTAKTVTAELTAYSNLDNQGGSNARICCATLHREAGGTGTALDPITTAVPGSGSSMAMKPGTKIYIPALAAYFIVEDSGATPTGKPRLDLWIDGRGMSDSAVNACMDKVTRTTTIIVNPPAGKPVGRVGPLADASGCHVAPNGS